MDYTLTGEFLEACDCTVICPCWVDDDPVGGHCTGFILWDFTGDSRIGGHEVAGCKVVSVSTHSGKRRDESPTTTVIYVDTGKVGNTVLPQDGAENGRPADLVGLLGQAFSGKSQEGPLADLATVSGTVTDIQRAHITFESGAKPKDGWKATVVKCLHRDVEAHGQEDTEQQMVVEADGRPEVFDEQQRRNAGLPVEPLTLENTALSYELRSTGSVQAQQGGRLAVNVGGLPGGSLEVTGRSGMRGTFEYQHPRVGEAVPAGAGAQQQGPPA